MDKVRGSGAKRRIVLLKTRLSSRGMNRKETDRGRKRVEWRLVWGRVLSTNHHRGRTPEIVWAGGESGEDTPARWNLPSQYLGARGEGHNLWTPRGGRENRRKTAKAQGSEAIYSLMGGSGEEGVKGGNFQPDLKGASS